MASSSSPSGSQFSKNCKIQVILSLSLYPKSIGILPRLINFSNHSNSRSENRLLLFFRLLRIFVTISLGSSHIFLVIIK
nr:MAG TPA: hypothetical protein [Caudoviricetes sp.]